jgi:hypothetical protein
MAQLKDEVVTLDPGDPFDAALIPIVQTNRRKRADYARDCRQICSAWSASGQWRRHCSTSHRSSAV